MIGDLVGGVGAGSWRRSRVLPIDRLVSVTVDDDGARVEPVTLDLVKLQQRLSTPAEDALLAIWIAAARAYFEETTGRATVDAVWELTITDPITVDAIDVPRPPLVTVDAVTSEVDGADAVLDPSQYVVDPSRVDGAPADPFCPPGRITLASGARWPTGPIRIRRTCGYGATPAAMPAVLQAALCLYVGHLYAHREAVVGETLTAIPIGLEPLIQQFKWTAFDSARHGRIGLESAGGAWPWPAPVSS
jgi:uncharacterized phiE125 gp8 family phage protein